jgi:hypothetical protein
MTGSIKRLLLASLIALWLTGCSQFGLSSRPGTRRFDFNLNVQP